MIKTVLNETSLKSKAIKLFKNPAQSKIKTFVILTGENPDIKKLTPKENKIQNQKLKDNLKNLCTVDKAINSIQYPYYKIKGCYENNIEHSFLIFNMSLDDAKYVAEKSHQESFIFGKNNDGELTFELWANKYDDGIKYDYNLKITRKCFSDNPDDEDYTKISKEFKFNIPFADFTNKAETITEHYNNRGFNEDTLMNLLSHLVSDEYSNRHRQLIRIKLYSPDYKDFY